MIPGASLQKHLQTTCQVSKAIPKLMTVSYPVLDLVLYLLDCLTRTVDFSWHSSCHACICVKCVHANS